MARKLNQVSRKLNKKDDTKAQELYEYIIDNGRDDKHAALAGANIAEIQLRLGDDAAARAIFDGVLSDFASHPILPQAVLIMAGGYWDRAFLEPRQNLQTTERAKEYFRKAIAEYENIITQFPEIPHTTAVAYYLAAECYYRLGQYEQAIEYYQEVADNWPEYTHAWLAQLKIANMYKWLLRAGAISNSETNVAMRVAYEQLLTNFPDCPVAGTVRKWLNYYNNKSAVGGQK